MTPGTRIRIHYPGDCKHGATGTVVAVRKTGSMLEHTVTLEKPIRLSGFKPIWKVYVTASRLRKLADVPKEAAGGLVVWKGNGPLPERARVSKRQAEPVKVITRQVTQVSFDDAITLGEAATILGVHRATVKNMISRGTLCGEQMGGRKTWYVRRAEIERLAETYTGRPGANAPRHSRETQGGDRRALT